MKLNTYKFGSGVSFEHKGSWFKTNIEAEFTIDEGDDVKECIKKIKKFVDGEIQKEIDEMTK
jgi:hypothetical protein